MERSAQGRHRVRRTAAVMDPTTLRLSEHFVLSDFLGCSSVYLKGFANIFDDPDGAKLAEGRNLCETLLEPILWKHGPLSITYGYVSPSLSQKIVTYQDPNKPSYHRWDKGAAADIVVHDWVRTWAPIYLAHEIDKTLPYSRMITYSESEGICLAAQLCEGDKPRRAFYENRYEGVRGAKPKYITYPTGEAGRVRARYQHTLEHDWRGDGYPTYHGGGRRQLHHTRVGEFSLLTDFLFSDSCVRGGIANVPSPKMLQSGIFERAAEFYAALIRILDVPRISITRGYETTKVTDFGPHNWQNGFALEFNPPAYITTEELSDAIQATGLVKAIGQEHGSGKVYAWEALE